MSKEDNIKVLCIVGARPNFMKIAPLLEEFKKYLRFNPVLVHTGQHYDEEMSENFFKELKIPKPDYNLGIKSGSHAQQTGKAMIEFEKVCIKEEPNLVIVVGDVNSTIATALTAQKLNIKIAHIEAGLRSGNMDMPEEVNRILTDHISDYLFTTCKKANKNLLNEGIPKEKIFFVGDIMVDTLLTNKERAFNRPILKKLDLNKNGYAVLTLHRPSNVDNKETLKNLVETFKDIKKQIQIVFPAHPRTQKRLKEFGLKEKVENLENLTLITPVPYLDMLCLIANSKFVLSDSGGIQQETTTLNIPCLTLREETERPVTIEEGTNTLVGTKKEKILKEVKKVLKENCKTGTRPKYWDGKTAKRIVKILNKLI